MPRDLSTPPFMTEDLEVFALILEHAGDIMAGVQAQLEAERLAASPGDEPPAAGGCPAGEADAPGA
ncbi:MAG: hypothetical protein QM692_23990 [Thermomicrobiales bacterium]